MRRVRVHLAPHGDMPDHRSGAGHGDAPADEAGRLRAGGLDPPPGRTGERHAAGALAATSADFQPHDRSDRSRGHGGEDDEGHRGGGKGLILGRRTEDHARCAVLNTVGAMGAMRIAAHGHGRRGGGRRRRPVCFVGGAMHDGAQHERHDHRTAKRRDESDPWKWAAWCPWSARGRTGRRSRHRSSAAAALRQRRRQAADLGVGRTASTNVTGPSWARIRSSSRVISRTGEDRQAGWRTVSF